MIKKATELSENAVIVEEALRARGNGQHKQFATCGELRWEVQLTRNEFGAAVRELVESGRVCGHKHDHVESMTQEELANCVNDWTLEDYGHNGEYHNGVFYVVLGVCCDK